MWRHRSHCYNWHGFHILKREIDTSQEIALTLSGRRSVHITIVKRYEGGDYVSHQDSREYTCSAASEGCLPHALGFGNFAVAEFQTDRFLAEYV